MANEKKAVFFASRRRVVAPLGGVGAHEAAATLLIAAPQPRSRRR